MKEFFRTFATLAEGKTFPSLTRQFSHVWPVKFSSRSFFSALAWARAAS